MGRSGGGLILMMIVAACGASTGLADLDAEITDTHDAGASQDADSGASAPDAAPQCACPEVDQDGDGEPGGPCGPDCAPFDPAIFSRAEDPSGDGVDTDCSGADGLDRDRDGAIAISQGGTDCDDDDPLAHPGAPDDLGWVVEEVPGPGVSASVLLAETGVPTVVDVDPVGCDTDTDGTIDLPAPAGRVLVSFRREGGWNTSPLVFCAPSGHVSAATGASGELYVSTQTEDCASVTAFHLATQGDVDTWGGALCELSPEPVAISSADCGAFVVAALDEEQRVIVARFDPPGRPQRMLLEEGAARELRVGWSGETGHVAYLFGDGDATEVHVGRGSREGWTVERVWDPRVFGVPLAMAFALHPEMGERLVVLTMDGIWVLASEDDGALPDRVDEGGVPSPGGHAVAAAFSEDGTMFFAWSRMNGKISELFHSQTNSTPWEFAWLADGAAPVGIVAGRGWRHVSWRDPAGGARYATFWGRNGADENCDGIR